MRLVDADAYSAEMKERQEAAWKWRNEAIAEEDEVKLARAEGAFTAFVEAKLTMDKHIINPWHRVEEELPSEFQDVWAACKMNGVENWTIETVYDPYLTCPWGYSIPELKSGKAVVYAWMDRSAPEPPKEDA